MRCIGTYNISSNVFLLYQMNYIKPGWISNICYYDTNTNSYYSSHLSNLALNGLDIDGGKRDEFYWSRYITLQNK